MPKNVRPFIRMYTGYKRMEINRITYNLLGKPPYFEFLWHEDKKLLLISALQQDKIGCYYVTPKVSKTQHSEISIRDTLLFNGLMGRLCWNDNMVYKVYGELLPECNMVAFRMANPIIMGVKN